MLKSPIHDKAKISSKSRNLDKSFTNFSKRSQRMQSAGLTFILPSAPTFIVDRIEIAQSGSLRINTYGFHRLKYGATSTSETTLVQQLATQYATPGEVSAMHRSACWAMVHGFIYRAVVNHTSSVIFFPLSSRIFIHRPGSAIFQASPFRKMKEHVITGCQHAIPLISIKSEISS